MNIEINRELVLNSCHITEEESESELFFDYSNDEANRRFLVESVIEDYDKKDHLDLYQIALIASALECKWVVFDADGPVVEQLPTYEW